MVLVVASNWRLAPCLILVAGDQSQSRCLYRLVDDLDGWGVVLVSDPTCFILPDAIAVADTGVGWSADGVGGDRSGMICPKLPYFLEAWLSPKPIPACSSLTLSWINFAMRRMMNSSW